MCTQAGHTKPAVDPRVWNNRVLKCDVIILFSFQHFHGHILVEHDERPSHAKFHMNWFMVAHPIEISVNWPGSY